MRKHRTLEDLRPIVAFAAMLVGVGLIVALYHSLDKMWADRLLDKSHTFPWSVQNAMWITFCLGLGELFIRVLSARAEIRQLSSGFLPEDPRVVLQAQDLPDIYRRVRSSRDANSCFLPRLVDRCILQFQASLSTAQSASLLNTSIEMFLHEVDLRYNMIRYVTWVIPSLGFIGTVVGIGEALEYAGGHAASEANLLSEVTGKLAVSFNGTFLALSLSSVLVLLQNVIQSKEEHALNLSGQYCLDNLINRLYVNDDSQ